MRRRDGLPFPLPPRTAQLAGRDAALRRRDVLALGFGHLDLSGLPRRVTLGFEVDNAWGVPVLTSTQFTRGKVVLLDTSRYRGVIVRESRATRIGYAGTDFTDNFIRLVAEERLTQTIERPKAICVISNLPTATL